MSWVLVHIYKLGREAVEEGLWDVQETWTGTAVGGEALADGLVHNYGM